MKATTITRTIAGRKVTLPRGHYLGSRPMASRGRKTYPITIEDYRSRIPVLTIDGLSYEAANEFLAAFNNGYSSFDGRIWN